MSNAVVEFEGVTLDIVDRDGKPWVTTEQVAQALGMKDAKGVHNIVTRHGDEFTPEMTRTAAMLTAGGRQQVRLFSARGCHMLGMLARTDRAKRFRKWALDVLDRIDRPAAAPKPARRVSRVESRKKHERVTATVRRQVLDLLARGYSWTDAANVVGVSRSTIARVMKQSDRALPAPKPLTTVHVALDVPRELAQRILQLVEDYEKGVTDCDPLAPKAPTNCRYPSPGV